MRRTAPRPALSVVVAALLLAAAPASPAAGAFPTGPYAAGEKVEVTGIVTAPGGEPIEGLRVALELSRRAFDIRQLRRTTRKTVKVADTTNAEGEYTITFPWDDYWNHFELVVGLPVRGAEGATVSELERLEMTRRIEKGSPVVATVVVENHEFVETFKAFLRTVDTPDERRVYEEQGRPDKVRTTSMPGGDEVTWWYFDRGRAYRFVGGELVGTESFEPVEELD